MEIPKSFLGYKRENGRAGTRNHVIILPVDDASQNAPKYKIPYPGLSYTRPLTVKDCKPFSTVVS